MRIICDIDGVLADAREYINRYLLKEGDWETYFEHTLEFPPILPVIALLQAFQDNLDNSVYLITGRPDSNRKLTEIWIWRNLRFRPYKLLMRPTEKIHNDESTSSMKMEVIREIKPDLIIDDDPKVAEAATKEGFTVLQVHGFRATVNDNIPFREVH